MCKTNIQTTIFVNKFWKTKHFKFSPEREEYAESHEESQQGDRIACKVKAKDVNLSSINLSHKRKLSIGIISIDHPPQRTLYFCKKNADK